MQTLTLVNGTPATALPVRDRGLQYGHGVFETVRLVRGDAPLWPLHRERLLQGCERLGIPLSVPSLDQQWCDLLGLPDVRSVADATVKLQVTAGESARGYRPPANPAPFIIVQWAERQFLVPETVCVRLCESQLFASAFAGLKHCNRLEQVMAAAELAPNEFEGVLCDTEGRLVEATSANLVLELGDKLVTPVIDQCGVSGVMRRWLLEKSGLVSERELWRSDLLRAKALYLVNSNYGIVPVQVLAHAGGNKAYLPTPAGGKLAWMVEQVFNPEAGRC